MSWLLLWSVFLGLNYEELCWTSYCCRHTSLPGYTYSVYIVVFSYHNSEYIYLVLFFLNFQKDCVILCLMCYTVLNQSSRSIP